MYSTKFPGGFQSENHISYVINQSGEITKDPIMELVSCFKDADQLRDESLIFEAEQALAGVMTNERIKLGDYGLWQYSKPCHQQT